MKEQSRPRPSEQVPTPSGQAGDAEPRVVGWRYDLFETLGRGAFAVTYRGRDRQTGQECVVKEVLYRKIEDPKVLELLEREARVLAHLRHSRIPRFIEFFSERVEGETRLYLVQGYVDGRSLAQLAQDGRHFTEPEVVRITLEVARILAYLHQLHPPIVHRDVKPGNVVLDSGGQAWLVDFGAVRDRILHEIRTEGEEATVVGTYGYMPFEQFQGRALPATDVYALGMTVVFLLSHKQPHEIEAVSGRLELDAHVRASRPLRRVIRRMIQTRPEDRYPSAVELCADLEALLKTPSPNPLVARRQRVVRVGLAATVLGLAAWGLVRSLPSMRPAAIPAVVPAGVPVPASLAPARPPAAHVQMLGLAVRGRLTHDGQPLETITDAAPNFWLRREGKGEVQTGTIRYERGSFVVSALPQGSIGMQTTVDLNPANPSSYPGDLYQWTVFDTIPPGPPLTIDLYKVIHLKAPQDNGVPMPGWGKKCPDMFTTSTPVQVEWEAPAAGLTYRYDLERIECPYKHQERVLDGTTTDLQAVLDLRPSGANDFYLLRLVAMRGDRTVASLITHGRGGMGWDYRFRVR
jgi:hypothetical protein